MTCVLCYESTQGQISWLTAVILEKQRKICFNCENKFKLIQPPICDYCGRPSQKSICHACITLRKRFRNFPLKKNRSIYTYNHFMQEVIANWKYRGDYMIVNAFAHVFRQRFMQYYKTLAKRAIISPIPLSIKRLHERRFNQAEALAKLLNLNNTTLLKRKDSEKQSKKSRLERLQSKNPFIVKTSRQIKQPVILIDDIYTTGMTLHHAATVLLERGCPAVYAFTLVRG